MLVETEESTKSIGIVGLHTYHSPIPEWNPASPVGHQEIMRPSHRDDFVARPVRLGAHLLLRCCVLPAIAHIEHEGARVKQLESKATPIHFAAVSLGAGPYIWDGLGKAQHPG